MTDSKYVTLEVSIKNETAKAYLMDINGKEHWMPKSQVKIKHKDGEAAVIEASEWILNANGIEFTSPGVDECPF